jgi:hypothetical protein
MSATPLISEPNAGLVWLEGMLSTKVVRTPYASIFEMRDPV